jgi:ankyrin repeat protein
VKLLLEKGAKLESKDKKYGQTPLSWAAARGHEVVVKLLLERSAELDSKDNNGRTSLSQAAENGNEAAVKLLLKEALSWNPRTNMARRRCYGPQRTGMRQW